MASNLSVRFVANFIITVVQTVLDEDTGQLVVREKPFHIESGDSYQISQYQRSEDNKVDLHFPDSSPLAGVAHRIEGDYCEVIEPKTSSSVSAKVTSGCGGCNKKKA